MKYLILFAFLSGFSNNIMDTIIHHCRNDNQNWVQKWVWNVLSKFGDWKIKPFTKLRFLMYISRFQYWFTYNDVWKEWDDLDDRPMFPVLYWIGNYHFKIFNRTIYPFHWIAIYKDGWHFFKWWCLGLLGLSGLWASNLIDLIIMAFSWFVGFFPMYQTYRIWKEK